MEQSLLSASAVTTLPVQSAMWETIQLLWFVDKVQQFGKFFHIRVK